MSVIGPVQSQPTWTFFVQNMHYTGKRLSTPAPVAEAVGYLAAPHHSRHDVSPTDSWTQENYALCLKKTSLVLVERLFLA